MSRVIWKHQVLFRPNTELKITQYAKFVHIGMQDGELFIWEEHGVEWSEKYTGDPIDPPMEDWVFNVYGTGHPVPDHAGTYIGTTQDGPFVWHIYGIRKVAK